MFKTAAILLALVAVGSQGREARHAQGPPGGFRLEMLTSPQAAEALGLTAEQQEKLTELRYSHEEKVLDIRYKLERYQLELRKLMETDNPNESKIKTTIRQIGSLRTDLELAHADVYFEARKILTDEQIAKLKTLRPQGKGHRGPKPQGQGGPPKE